MMKFLNYIIMQKVLLIPVSVLIALLFVGCSCFDSKPVEPKILGISRIVDDGGLVFVEIDSVRYPVKFVYTGETHPRIGDDVTITPVDGMFVTVVQMEGNTAYKGMQFMLGEWNKEQIERAFYRNYTLFVITLGVILFCVIGIFTLCYRENQKKSRIYAQNNIK